MKKNRSKQRVGGDLSDGGGTAAANLAPETEAELAPRRWELAPILYDGQNVGWTVVKII